MSRDRFTIHQPSHVFMSLPVILYADVILLQIPHWCPGDCFIFDADNLLPWTTETGGNRELKIFGLCLNLVSSLILSNFSLSPVSPPLQLPQLPLGLVNLHPLMLHSSDLPMTPISFNRYLIPALLYL